MVHFNASRVQFSLRDADTGSGLSLITRARVSRSRQRVSRWLETRPRSDNGAKRLLPELFSFHLLPGQLDQSELCVADTEPIGSRQGTLILRWVGGIRLGQSTERSTEEKVPDTRGPLSPTQPNDSDPIKTSVPCAEWSPRHRSRDDRGRGLQCYKLTFPQS